MSLTGHIRLGQGPVWSWFAEWFPRTQSLCIAANRQLRSAGAEAACPVAPLPGSDRGLVGTAVGYVLAAHLREDAWDRTVATEAAIRLDEVLRRAKVSPSRVERAAVERMRELSPANRALSLQEWGELCRLACVVSRYEQYFRIGFQALGPIHQAHHLRRRRGVLPAIVEAMADEVTVEDLSRVAQAAVEDHRGLRSAEGLQLGANFAQSEMLGGADADVIAGGTLFELKSTGTAKIVDRAAAWQILGYLLADTDDRYEIRRVAVSALRWRQTVSWDVAEFLRKLAVGGLDRPLAEWRSRFALMLETARATRVPRVVGRPDAARGNQTAADH